jgi:hypothetical protein
MCQGMRSQFDKIYFVGVIARGARIEMLITLVGEELQQGRIFFMRTYGFTLVRNACVAG